ncbi:GntR family transcriptional regulator [Streptosporangium amethystogenes subsp. fukuiense]|uniref:GntR family transcriptional regulator n=1 Tax=Streptosporangium amethystogenes subsp. fukuiense TaxID=698418 RepID=A0ABW2T055_9ACTN
MGPGALGGLRRSDSQRPLWEVIAASLRADILEARYTPGAPLPSETALSARYSVSRPTVRDAVKALVGEGLVSVVRGRGTFVRAVPDRHAILLGTWPRHDIADPEFIPTARQWGWTQLATPHADDEGQQTYSRSEFSAANRDIASTLGLRTGHTVFHRHSRWRHTTTGLIITINSYTVPEIIPAPTTKQAVNEAFVHALTQTSFYDTITSGRGPATWETSVTARMPYADERDLMALSVGSPILIIRRILADKDGRPLEMTEIKADAERFETVYARENLTSLPEGFDPDIHDPEQLQEKPDPEPTGRILFLL